MNAANLPIGSQVDHNGCVVARTEDWAGTGHQRWVGDDGVAWGQTDVSLMLDRGAQVLRVGDGTEQP